VQYNVERASQLRQVPPHRGSHPAANAIAFHGAAQNFTHCKTHTRAPRACAFAIKSNHVPGKVFFALPVNRLKVGMFKQS